MKLMHFLLDTKDKRESIAVALFLLFLLSEVIRNILLLVPMITIPSLESLYVLIPYAKNSFIGRIILSFYSLSKISIFDIILKIVNAFSLVTIVCVILSIYFICTNEDTKMVRVAKRVSWINLFITAITYCGTSVFVLQAIRFTTYEIVLNQVHYVSLWMLIMHCLTGLILLIALYSVIRNLLDALDFVAVEEK